MAKKKVKFSEKLKNISIVVGGFSLLFIVFLIIFTALSDKSRSISRDVIIVRGESVKVKPTINLLKFKIWSKDDDREKAKDKLNEQIDNNRQKLESFEERIQNISVQRGLPACADQKNQEICNNGYLYTATLELEYDEKDEKLREELIQKLEDVDRVSGPKKEIKRDVEYEFDNDKMFDEAMDNAKKKAEKIAKENNKEIVDIIKVEEDPVFSKTYTDKNEKIVVVEVTYKIK